MYRIQYKTSERYNQGVILSSEKKMFRNKEAALTSSMQKMDKFFLFLTRLRTLHKSKNIGIKLKF